MLPIEGADPYKFAELRDLGLKNEQISWKQRFFIPTDETTGIDTVTALLDRYPMIATDEPAIEDNATTFAIKPQIRAANIVDLDQWIVAVESANAICQPIDESDYQSEERTPEAPVEEPPPFALTQEVAISWTQFGQITQSQLAFDFG